MACRKLAFKSDRAHRQLLRTTGLTEKQHLVVEAAKAQLVAEHASIRKIAGDVDASEVVEETTNGVVDFASDSDDAAPGLFDEDDMEVEASLKPTKGGLFDSDSEDDFQQYF